MLRAELVLEDCRRVLDMLEREENTQDHRILWVAGITLARAVGHVLKEVDRKSFPKMKVTLDRLFRVWNDESNTKDSIFRDFIKKERDLVLKEYSFGYDDGDYMITAGGHVFELPGLLYCPLKDGAFGGEDCRNLLRDSIEWWDVQLHILQKEIQDEAS